MDEGESAEWQQHEEEEWRKVGRAQTNI